MKLFAYLFAGRFRIVSAVLAAYLIFNALIRLGLLIFNGDWTLLTPATLLPVFAAGFLFDLAAACWWLPLYALLAAFWPDRWRVPLLAVSVVLSALTFFAWSFVGVAEFVFWNEFSSRFNFIAVDYLIYTREVIGNIRESYDLRPMFAGIGVMALLMLVFAWRFLRQAAAPAGMPLRARLGRLAIFLLLPALSFFVVDARYKEFSHHAQATQLAGNGHYEFWHAFRTNEIDYTRFYRTEAPEQAYRVLRAELERGGPQHFIAESPLAVERDVAGRGPERHLNVVLITVESLSAEFLGVFGNQENLTPNLDRLAEQGMLFTQLYATGTRTVRGLEAVALSIPPTPGNSIVKRPNNDGFRALGAVFAERGYEPLYIYGGYGYFDNMNAFFSGNGYTVIDRTAIPKEAIHMENIWGVADEDLFTLALGELDQRAAENRRFFAHIMTTSNHRPYTYPDNRIDIPSGTGREGAVKYTDWAIGDFIERARAKPWFANTVFVILADHTASGRGKTDLPVEQFKIPMIFYSPGNIAPAKIETLASQIDVGPTLLAQLNFSYRSRFFGHDIITEGPRHQRAFLANYQTVGYFEDNMLIELRPQQRWRLVDPVSGEELPASERGQQLLSEAISYYQSAAEAFRSGILRQP
ncbi:MAG: sulfatase-like hydrolase/transferase [Zoogloeaceae bacterium]|nr:sulfatase-like hydrolase/transferase [Zoogloeaceae bacterium]